VIQPFRALLGWLAFVFLTALLGAGCGNQPAPPPHPSASEAVKKEPAPKLIAVPPQPEPHFAVQIGAFADRARAEALASQLSNLYQQEILVAPVEVRGKTLYRVRFLVGTKAGAEALANSMLREQRLKAWVVVLP
jgi:cell division septation protein DedD